MIGPNHARNVAKKERRRLNRATVVEESRESFASTTDAITVPSVADRQNYMKMVLSKTWDMCLCGEIDIAALMIEVDRRCNFNYFNEIMSLEQKLTPIEVHAIIMGIHTLARQKLASEGKRLSKLQKRNKQELEMFHKAVNCDVSRPANFHVSGSR